MIKWLTAAPLLIKSGLSDLHQVTNINPLFFCLAELGPPSLGQIACFTISTPLFSFKPHFGYIFFIIFRLFNLFLLT
jgi:hypothetical protein